ncbi:MAG: RHS domain-containing protein [Acidobacteria bacterium]|nr:RHS domain-containing protein [Acidobacteriota bacterium]
MKATASLDPESWLLTPATEGSHVWFAGAPVAQVTHSVPSEPLAAPEVVWTVTDHLGTPRIQADSTGAIVWHAEHEPYGRIYLLREGEGRHQPLRFPGQEAEQLGVNAANGITDRNYNIFRWYRAAEGRYTQADPAGLFGGLNLYIYVGDEPISGKDPLALWKPGTKIANPYHSTTICNGDGGVTYQISKGVTEAEMDCFGHCIKLHEITHVFQVVEANPGICLGKPPGLLIESSSTEELHAAEYEAYVETLKCLGPIIGGLCCPPLAENYRDTLYNSYETLYEKHGATPLPEGLAKP